MIEVGRQTGFALPDEANGFLFEHVAILLESHRRLGLGDLLDPGLEAVEAARSLFEAPFAVASHDGTAEPVFNYGNRKALELFEMDWEEFTRLPSRESAKPVDQAERQRLLEAVRDRGYVTDYRGVRIAASGRLFFIEDAVVWNLTTAAGRFYGQAACFSRWTFLPSD
jgi:hypothetical protein